MPGSTFVVKDELADKVVQNGGVTRRILQEAVKNGSGGGLTEAAQELIQATAVGMMGTILKADLQNILKS